MVFLQLFLQDLPKRPCLKWVSTKCTRKSLQSFQKRHKNLSSHALRQTQSSGRRQLNFWNILFLTSKFTNLFRLCRSSEQPHKPMIFVLSLKVRLFQNVLLVPLDLPRKSRIFALASKKRSNQKSSVKGVEIKSSN